MKDKINPSSLARRIHLRASERAKRYLTAEAEMLDSVIEIAVNQTFLEYGFDTITRYVQEEFKLSEEVSANFVRVANKAKKIPQLKEAIDQLRFSVTQAKVMASVITPANHPEWIEKAATLSKRALEKAVAIASPKAIAKEQLKPIGEDRNRFQCELDDESVELIRRAMVVLANKQKKVCSKAELLKLALQEYVERHDPVRKAERSRDGSTKVKVKHETNKRDQGKCQYVMPNGKICGAEYWVDQHHINFKSRGGKDELGNMVTLCSRHHRRHHRMEQNQRL